MTGFPGAGEAITVMGTGSRDWRDRKAVWAPLDRLLVHHKRVIVFNGKCKHGADRLLGEWVLARERYGASEVPFYADWDKHGNRAGFVRNGEMVKKGPDVALVWANPCIKRDRRWCPPGVHPSHGTADCVDQARDADILVRFCPTGMSW